MTVALSIAIPTYNGACYIQETLESMIIQLDDIAEEIEIVISDNASTDETPEIIRKYQQKYPFIKYFRNEENLGADRNFDLAVRRSRGEYVWLFGDDDVMVPGIIRKVLAVLRSHRNLAAVFVNSAFYCIDLKECYKERVLEIQQDIYCEHANEFLATVKIAPGCVSANIIRRLLWEQANPERYLDTNLIHYGTLCALIPGHSAYCVATLGVIQRAGGHRWIKDGSSSIITGCKLMEIVRELPKLGYSKGSVREVANVLMHSLPFTIFLSKRAGLTVTPSLLKKMVKQFGKYPSFWLLDIPLLLLPRSGHNFIWQTYQNPSIKRIYKICKRAIMRTT